MISEFRKKIHTCTHPIVLLHAIIIYLVPKVIQVLDCARCHFLVLGLQHDGPQVIDPFQVIVFHVNPGHRRVLRSRRGNGGRQGGCVRKLYSENGVDLG